ncbi:hypothetical protein TWF225_008425 [Orbilia oligospora]|nr:hypothetical protein TWF225_008425 [Orbilia oligospora]KAF3244506.1 hypothetical protein TWF217_010747 [Orbilia oligospora]KAF3268183.1 hypothetical protein TWF128_008186 [Orbilia oligospora]KAF3295969.1 hypothetical protein TWF132_000515 [Orbilia oligospora]
MYTETGSGPEYAAAIGHIRLEKLKSRTRSLWNYFSDEASPYQVIRIKLSFAYDIFGVSLKQQMAPFVLCPGSIKGVVPTSYSEDGRLLAFADDTWVYLYDTKEDLFSGVRVRADLKIHRLSICSRNRCLNVGYVRLGPADPGNKRISTPRNEQYPIQSSSSPLRGLQLRKHPFKRDIDAVCDDPPFLYFHDHWLWFGSHKIFWIPRPYRSERYSCTSDGLVTVGCPNGNVYRLQLDLKALAAELQMGRSEPRKDWFCICRLREKERAAPHTGLIDTRNHEAHPDTSPLNDSDYYICQQIESQMKSYDLSASDGERRYFSVSLNRYVRE